MWTQDFVKAVKAIPTAPRAFNVVTINVENVPRQVLYSVNAENSTRRFVMKTPLAVDPVKMMRNVLTAACATSVNVRDAVP